MKTDLTKVTDWRTDSVLAACYKGKTRDVQFRTHYVGSMMQVAPGDRVGRTVVLCGSVDPDSMCGDPTIENTKPTCPACLKRMESVIYRTHHNDFKGKTADGTRTVLQYERSTGSTVVMAILDLPWEEIRAGFTYGLEKMARDAERKAERESES